MRQNINVSMFKEYVASATNLIKDSVLEDVLRHNLSAWMPRIFEDNPWWISVHISGTESRVKFANESGSNRGFVDSLVGKTVIEYEKDLTKKSIFESGFGQIKDYSAALLNQGISYEDIIGILSDTINWYAYKIVEVKDKANGKLYGREHIILEEIEHISIAADDISLRKFVSFIEKYIGREGSRSLNARSLANDMGLESSFCRQHMQPIKSIITEAFDSNPQYANLIKEVWCNFVSYLGGETKEHSFRMSTYIDEFYIITLAKFLCVNILEGRGVVSNSTEILHIINGCYFKTKGVANLVEYDYFGWINDTPYAEKLVDICYEIQSDLLAYDFTNIQTEDLFGQLVAQLARKEQRLLLGQEYTPHWLAEKMVKNAILKLPNEQKPKFLDMCCGSGVFIIETLNQIISEYNINQETCSQEDINYLQQCIMGFDIDPVAVILARVNWVLIMKKFIPYSSTDFIIPIFHADSLFVITPISKRIDREYKTKMLELNFAGNNILLPGFLLDSQNAMLFDTLIKSSYSIALNRAQNQTSNLSKEFIGKIINGLVNNISNNLDLDEVGTLEEFCCKLVTLLEKMQREGKNGIWPFVLENSYRPALVQGQFNGIVSNPPWMAMSKLADNPYRWELRERAKYYGIHPKGASHLHLELATIFLVQSADYYLADNAVIACITPDSVLNGYQHEPFRRGEYNKIKCPVNMFIDEIWEIDSTTFKNRAIAIFGMKSKVQNEVNASISGMYLSSTNKETCNYKLLIQGDRTAWSNNPKAKTVGDALAKMNFLEGADIMPRTTIFHHCSKQPNGMWSIEPIKRFGDELSFLVGQAKNYKDFTISAKNIKDEFVFKCFLSNHLTPFYLSNPADALLPITRDDEGNFRALIKEEEVLYGNSTIEVFKTILKELNYSYEDYYKKLNFRNKLNDQVFSDKGYLVVAGAGGSNVCAGYIDISNMQSEKIIIDQTLYWYIVETEEEALYIVGVLNSKALGEAIREFQPEGLLGKRHIHKLPYQVTPLFDRENSIHINVVEKTRKLIEEWKVQEDEDKLNMLRNPNGKSLSERRKQLRISLSKIEVYEEYNKACNEVYGIENE